MTDNTPFDPYARIEHNMTNHAPAGPEVVEKFEVLRTYAKAFARTIVDISPASREQSLALTAAEESLMWAVAAVARYQGAQ